MPEYFLIRFKPYTARISARGAQTPQDFDGGRLRELNRTIKDHHLKIACFTPEQCVYPISVSHPDKRYRDRTVDFFQRHIEAAVCLDCSCMVVSLSLIHI